MKIKILISLIFISTLFALNSYAVLEPNPNVVYPNQGYTLADQLIDESRGTLPGHHSLSPKDVRALWQNNSQNNSSLFSPMPGTLSSGQTPQASRTQSQGQGIANSASSMSETTIAGSPRTQNPTPASANLAGTSSASSMTDTTIAGSPIGIQNPIRSSANLAGTWSLNLNDASPKQVVLTIFQIEDKIFGSGSMKNGDNTLVVAASGALKGDQIYLDITSIGTIGLYSLVMNSSADSAIGDYKAYMANGQTWKGKVQGTKSLPIS